MSHSWEKLRALTAEERWLLAQSMAALPVAAAGLALLGWQRLRQALMRRGGIGARRPELPPEYPFQAARMSNLAGGQRGLRATCLQKSVVLWWLLERQGIDCAVVIGVRKDGEALRSHAWVEYEGKPLNDRHDIRQIFTALDAF